MGLRVVIPVAGAGTRLRPYTYSVPKVMVPVAGMPMLGHILDELRAYDVEEVTLIVGYLGDKVREYVTHAFPYRFRFVEQAETLGLGHAIWLSAEGYREGGPVLVILGDTIFDADFASILRSEENWIGVHEVEDPRRFGVCVLDAEGRIVNMVEKPQVPPSNLAIVGIYYFSQPGLLYQCLDEVIEKDIRTKGEYQLTDALQMMLERGARMRPFPIQGWFDCGKPETLLETNRNLLDKYQARGSLTIPEGVEIEGSIVNPPVAFEGKATLKNAIVGPYVSVGVGASIADAIVSDSIVADDASVTKAILRSSIVADNAKVVGHAYRLNVGDTSEIDIL